MFKINNKGFMMVEVIVVSAVLLTVIVTLYYGFNSMYHSYKIRSSYYSVDGAYASYGYLNMYIDELMLARILASTSFNNNSFVDLSDCNNTTYYIDNTKKSLCNSIKSTYKIKNIYFMMNNLGTLKSSNSFDVNMQDYLEYLDSIGFVSNTTTYNYLIIVKTESNDYNCLRIR